MEGAQKQKDVSVCFFFCKYGEPAKSTFHSMARTFLLQLLQQNQDLLPYIYDRQVESGAVTLRGGTTLEALLCEGLKNSGNTKIIIDGLDECEKPERTKILAWLKSTIGGAHLPDDTSPMKAMVVSTNELDIKKALSKFLRKEIQPTDVDDALQSYLALRILELQQKFGLSEAESADIVQIILQRANGNLLFSGFSAELSNSS